MRQEWLGSEKAGLTDKNGGMLQKIDRVSKKTGTTCKYIQKTNDLFKKSALQTQKLMIE